MNAVAPLPDDAADLLAQIRAARVYEVAQASAPPS
jgi:threonine dehydratase